MSLRPIPKGEQVKGSITKHMDKRFLSSIDLIGAGEVALTIDRVEHHDKIDYENGSKGENVNLQGQIHNRFYRLLLEFRSVLPSDMILYPAFLMQTWAVYRKRHLGLI